MMPASSPIPKDYPRYPDLRIGMEFNSIQDGINAVTDAIVKAHESFEVVKGNSEVWIARCRNKASNACTFRVILTLSPLALSLTVYRYALPSLRTVRKPNSESLNLTIPALLPHILAGSGRLVLSIKPATHSIWWQKIVL